MKANQLKKTVLIGFLFCAYLQSSGWGMTGHRVVGQIAQNHLSSKAKKELRKILGNESIAMASNWADFVRSDQSYAYLSPWHYINFMPGLNYAEFAAFLEKDTAVDAYTKINFLVAELKAKKQSQQVKLIYLRLLIHLVGDIHQPLHTGKLEDLGGNKIKVLWFNEPTNLHHVWDDELVAYQRLSYTEYAAALDHASEIQISAWQKQPLTMWLFESYQHSAKIYGAVNQDDKLGYRYNFDNVAVLNEQLLKGGIRLAGLLNEIFA